VVLLYASRNENNDAAAPERTNKRKTATEKKVLRHHFEATRKKQSIAIEND
jgi:hypothetical protein